MVNGEGTVVCLLVAGEGRSDSSSRGGCRRGSELDLMVLVVVVISREVSGRWWEEFVVANIDGGVLK